MGFLQSTFGKRGGTSWKRCLFSHPKGGKSSRQSAWQEQAKLGEHVTHVLQEGQVEPLCTTVQLSVISVNLTACWRAGS